MDSAAPDLDTPKRFSLLVADDNTVNLKVIRIILNRLGHEADTVENGAEAVAAVAAKSYDAILMDVQMPVMDGLTATREILTDCEARSVIPPVIIALTAAIMAEDQRACKAAGMKDFLKKPVKPAEIVNCLNRWCAPAAAS